MNSYIMPYRKSSDDRERNLSVTIDWIRFNITDMEIVIVEMDSEPRIAERLREYPLVKYIFIQDEKVFNRGRARNIGAMIATGDVLVFGDNDIIMTPSEFNHCVERCKNEFEAVNPFCVMVDLSEEDMKELVISDKNPFDASKIKEKNAGNGIENHRRDLNFAAGISILRRDCFFRIGGWPEEFIGWGGEDDIFSYKIDRFLHNKSYTYFAYHLPHTRFIYDWDTHPEYTNNCAKMNRVLGLSDDEFIGYCMKNRLRILSFPDSKMSEEEIVRVTEVPLVFPLKSDKFKSVKINGEDVQCYPLFMDE